MLINMNYLKVHYLEKTFILKHMVAYTVLELNNNTNFSEVWGSILTWSMGWKNLMGTFLIFL
jgi:hypothetical protein